MNPIALAHRLRHSERLAPVRRHLPLAATVAGVASTRREPRRGLVLLTLGGLGFVRTWRRSRELGRAATAEHIARMRRLRRDVVQRFYTTCIGSMEAELEEYPEYDRRKHELRYRLVSELATAHVPAGGVVVDVGCASGLVLDAVHRARHSRGVGFDLAPYGVRQRAHRPDPPVLAQAVVEHIPLPDGVADVVVFSEVIEHLLDAYAGLREVSRITRGGGVVILTTNNGSEMPVISPLRDPLTWFERLAGRWRPRWLAFRNLTWHDPIDRRVDPLPPDAPTYVPHIHFCFAELRDLAADAGFRLLSSSSFEFPAPQSPLADRLRRLTSRAPRLGNATADLLEGLVSVTPGLSLMGAHHLLVLRKVAPPRPRPSTPWWPAHLHDGLPTDGFRPRASSPASRR
ncbi:MAG: class I SAM-dependent methyltransferase [Chloroflexi bacterium]|nr:MAG: class I SAM-dependent methyltransferase [Chloroflexota bacterium]